MGREPKRVSVRIRSEDHVARLVVALVREEVSFSVLPERDGWWKVTAAMPVDTETFQSDMLLHARRDLAALEQQTRCIGG